MFSLLGISVLLAATGDIRYAIPLIVAISLVYAATRFERMPHILWHAARTGLWICGFMGIIYLLLMWVSWGL